MPEQAIELKGSLFTLSALQLTQSDMTILKSALQNKISQAPNFFYRAPVVVNIEQLLDQPIDFSLLKQTIETLDLVLVGISGGSNEQKQQAKEQGLAVLNPGKEPAVKVSPEIQHPPAAHAPPDTMLHKQVEIVEKIVHLPPLEYHQNIRSGQQVYAKDRDLIIMGSVSHGAEVIADGNIHVYGTLRGRAIAGATGNPDAKIYCQNLQAELVSICGNYMVSDALQNNLWEHAVSIHLLEEKLIINAFN